MRNTFNNVVNFYTIEFDNIVQYKILYFFRMNPIIVSPKIAGLTKKDFQSAFAKEIVKI